MINISASIASVVTSLVLLTGGPGMNIIRDAIVWSIQDKLNGRVDFERIEMSSEKHLVMHNVTISLPENLGGEEIAGIEEVWVKFNGWSGLVGDAPFYNLGIDGIQINYIEDIIGNGKSSFDIILDRSLGVNGETNSSSQKPFELPFVLHDLQIKNGSFQYFDPRDSTMFAAKGVDFQGSVSKPINVKGEINIQNIAFDIKGYKDEVANVNSVIYYEDKTLTINNLTMEAAFGSPITYYVEGEISMLDGQSSTLDFSGNGQVGAVLDIIGIDKIMPGILNMTGSLKNSLTDPEINIQLTSPAVNTEYGLFELVTIDMEYSKNRITIPNFKGSHRAGDIFGHGLLEFTNQLPHYRLEVESPKISLSDFQELSPFPDVDLEGELEFNFGMEGYGFKKLPSLAELRTSSKFIKINQFPLNDIKGSIKSFGGNFQLNHSSESFQSSAEGLLDPNGQIQLSGLIKVGDLTKLPPPLRIPNVQGAADLEVTIVGTQDQYSIGVLGWLDNSSYSDIQIGKIKFEAVTNETRVLLFDAQMEDKVTLHTKVDMAGNQPINGYLKVNNLRLSDYFIGQKQFGFDALLEMEGEITGTFQQPHILGKGKVRKLIIENEDLGETDLDITLSLNQIDFTMIRNPGPSVFAEGTIQLNPQYPYDLHVELYDTSLSQLLSILYKRPISRSTGWFTGEIHALGKIGNPDLSTITVSLDSLGIVMEGRELHFAAPSTVKLENQVITVDDFRLTGDFGQVMVNGTASLASNGQVDLETVLEGVRLEFISPFLVSEGTFSGGIDGVINLKGTPDYPQINSLLTISDVNYKVGNRTNLLGTVTLSALYENKIMEVPVLAIQSPIGRSEINLSYPVDLRWSPSIIQEENLLKERYSASLVVDNLAVAPLREFFELIPADLDGYIRGRIDVEGAVHDSHDITGIVALDSLKLFGLQNEFVNLDPIKLTFDSEYIETDLLSATIRSINQPRDQRGFLTMQGRLAYGAEKTEKVRSDFKILGEKIKMDAVTALVNIDLPISGEIDAQVHVKGPNKAQTIDAYLFMDQLRYNQASIDSVVSHIIYSAEGIDIKDLRVHEKENLINVKGFIPLNSQLSGEVLPSRDISLDIKGNDINLSFLSGIVYDLEELEGKADIQLSINGSSSSPNSIGQVLVKSPGIKLRNFNPMFKSNEFRIGIDSNSVHLDPVEFKAGGGQIRISSDMLLSSLSIVDINMDAQFENAGIERIGSAKLELNGLLGWTGSQSLSRIYNKDSPIVITGVVMHPLNLGDFLFDNDIIRPPGTPSPFWESVSLDIAVDIPDLAIENDIAQLTIEGGVAFTNSAQNPIVTGNAIAKDEGEIKYLDTTFNLELGRIDLTRRFPLENFSAMLDYPIEQLNPDLTLQATAQRVRDIYGTEYDVELSTSGPVSTVTPQLQASPIESGSGNIGSKKLTGPEVISLLTLGLPGITNMGSADAMAGIGSRAILMATGASAEKLLKLDEVQLEGDIFTGNSNSTGTPAQITLSKRLNRRARVSYTRLFDSSEYTFRVGYQLTDFLFIETFSEQSGEHPQNGIDLKVKFRFR